MTIQQFSKKHSAVDFIQLENQKQPYRINFYINATEGKDDYKQYRHLAFETFEEAVGLYEDILFLIHDSYK